MARYQILILELHFGQQCLGFAFGTLHVNAGRAQHDARPRRQPVRQRVRFMRILHVAAGDQRDGGRLGMAFPQKDHAIVEMQHRMASLAFLRMRADG